MLAYVWIAVGSALGGMARHGCGALALRYLGAGFPWGTLIVNIVGSFVIGILATFTVPGGRLPLDPLARMFLMTGFCGGFTTFSAFSLQTVELLQAGAVPLALAYIGLSVLLCLAATGLGLVAGNAG